MKELDQHIKKGDKISIVKQKKKEFQYVLQGIIVPHGGHKVWSVNELTREVKEAEYTTEAIKFTEAARGISAAEHRLVIEENCIYVPALNKENALKKFDKNKLQANYYKKQSIASLGDHFYE